MSQYSSAEFRKLLNELNNITNKDIDTTEEENDNSVESIDSTLVTPADYEIINKSVNAEDFINKLNIPDDHVSDFKSAIDKMKNPIKDLSYREMMSLAIAFNRAINKNSIHEDLDPQKIKSYVARNTQTPSQSTSNNNDIEDTRKIIDAVKKYGTNNEKKELGI